MTVRLGYDEVRAIAKKIGTRVNREIKGYSDYRVDLTLRLR